MKKKKFRGVWRLPVLIVLLALTVFSVMGVRDYRWSSDNRSKILTDFGIALHTPYIKIDGQLKEVGWVVEECPDSGAFYVGGVRQGDIILPSWRFRWRAFPMIGFLKWIDSSRGKTVNLTLVDGGDGADIFKRPRKVVTVLIPDEM